MDYGYIAIVVFLLILLYIIYLGSTPKTQEGRENWYYGVVAGILFSVIGFITGKANEDKIENLQYKRKILDKFIGGLKNLFIRKG